MAQLTKNEQKVVDAFRQVQTNLFPDGNIPSIEEVKQRIDTGNYTIRDAFIAKMYNDGVPNEPLLAELDDTKEFYNKFNTAFSREVIGPARNTLGISNNLAKLSKKEIDLVNIIQVILNKKITVLLFVVVAMFLISSDLSRFLLLFQPSSFNFSYLIES